MRPAGTTVIKAVAAVVLAAGLGTVLAVLYAAAADTAFDAHSREWDMGAIPMLLASICFVGFLAGVAAGRAAPARPYLAATIAIGGVIAAASWLDPAEAGNDLLSPAWAPIGLLTAWWGALVVDPLPAGRAARFALLRDASYVPAWFVSFFALLGAGLHYVPRYGAWLAGIIPAALLSGIARRNRRQRAARTGPPER